MKRLFTVFICITTLLLSVAGCAKSPQTQVSTVKTGLGVVNSIASSTDAGAKDGLAQIDSVIAAITLGADGKIIKCMIDSAQTKINFSKDGKILTPLDTQFPTKQELGSNYGMKKASSIGKEWGEEASAFAAYVIGKTVNEVKGIAVNQEGVPTGADLKTSVTIHVTDFIAAIEKAAATAEDMGAKSGDKLGLGILTNISKSANAGDKDGTAEAYSTYTAVTFGADGKVSSCKIDASQSDVTFDKTGKITADLKAKPQTKDEIGEKYGMKAASSIGKEWNQEAASFAKYTVGKTLSEIKGIAVSKEGVPTGADLKSSVTIHIGDFVTVIEKASGNAK